MMIKPSAVLRQDYNQISKYCKETGEPVYITKNGEGDLVVMDIDAFQEREKMLKISCELLEIRAAREAGAKYYTLEEFNENMLQTIRDVADEKRKAV